MKNEVNEMVKKIQETKAEVQGLEKQIAIMGKEKLNQIIQIVLNGLEFEEIYKSEYFHDEESEQVEELFLGEEGEGLRGLKVLSLIDDSNELGQEEWELHKELFLLQDGTFKTFDALYRSYHCPNCEVMHSRVDREEADKEIVIDYKDAHIIDRIMFELKRRVKSLELSEKLLKERLKKLNSLMVS